MFKRSQKKNFKRDLILPDNKLYYTYLWKFKQYDIGMKNEIKEKQINLPMQICQMLNLIYQILWAELK